MSHREGSAAGGRPERQHECAAEALEDAQGPFAAERPESRRQNEGAEDGKAGQYSGQPGAESAQRAEQRTCAANGGGYERCDAQRARPQHRSHHAADHRIERLRNQVLKIL